MIIDVIIIIFIIIYLFKTPHIDDILMKKKTQLHLYFI